MLEKLKVFILNGATSLGAGNNGMLSIKLKKSDYLYCPLLNSTSEFEF